MTPRARARTGEGSVYWSPSKQCWRIRLSITDSDGRRRQPSVGEYATREEAIAAHRAARAAPASDWTTKTWAEWLSEDIPRFVAALRRREQDSYADIIDRYFRLHLNHRLARLGRMTDTTPKQLDGIWDDLTASGLARSSVKRMKSAVSSCFIRAQAEGLQARNPLPLSTLPGRGQRKGLDVRPVELDEVLSLDEYLALRDRMIHLIMNGPTSDTRVVHFALPTVVLGETGARRSEALGLQAIDLRPNQHLRIERQVHIKRAVNEEALAAGVSQRRLELGPPKTESSYPTIQMSDLLHGLLEEHIKTTGATGRDQLFVKPATSGLLHPDAFSTFVRKQAKLAGINRAIGPHTLRHTHATLLFAHQQPDTFISQRLGHDNSAFTRKQYVKFITDMDGTGKAWDLITTPPLSTDRP